VIVARNLDQAPKAVQIQALELLRTRRIFTRTSVQAAPKQFLFVPVLRTTRGCSGALNQHLNEYFFIAHRHHPDDGFPYLDEEVDIGDDAETESTESVVKKSTAGDEVDHGEVTFPESVGHHLASDGERVDSRLFRTSVVLPNIARRCTLTSRSFVTK
jgi:hypothetical protein